MVQPVGAISLKISEMKILCTVNVSQVIVVLGHCLKDQSMVNSYSWLQLHHKKKKEFKSLNISWSSVKFIIKKWKEYDTVNLPKAGILINNVTVQKGD